MVEDIFLLFKKFGCSVNKFYEMIHEITACLANDTAEIQNIKLSYK